MSKIKIVTLLRLSLTLVALVFVYYYNPLASLPKINIHKSIRNLSPASQLQATTAVNSKSVTKGKPKLKEVHHEAKTRTFLLTMVISAPANTAKRDVIRRTWKNGYSANQEKKPFLVKFVVGTLKLSDKEKELLLAENEAHEDMLLLTHHLDNYNNLTRKVLQTFVWADQNANFSYMAKVDDDTFVRLDAIESELKARKSSKPLYWGFIISNIWPQKNGKWKEENWDISERYLPYALGGGYVLSAELIHSLVVNSDSLILYNNEDVSVGAWVSPFVLERKFDKRFGTYINVDYECIKDYLLMHCQNVESMEKRHKLMKTTGAPCQ